jgi:hypothetical protein
MAANLAGADPSPESLTASRITIQRRLIARLKNCSAVNGLENQATMTESLTRRVNVAKWKSPEQQRRLARLPKIRACLAAVASLYDHARQVETEVLSAFYQRQNLEDALLLPELEAMDKERQRLLREIFRLRLDDPDDIVIAVYSEHQAALLELAAAYCRLAKRGGQVIAFDYLLPPKGARSSASKPVREPVKKLDRPFDPMPENAIGLVMHLRGDLIFARLQAEKGLHAFKDKDAEHLCLVDTNSLPFDKYEPPPGIERHGAIKSKSASLCRRFDREKELVTDVNFGERPWRGIAVDECMRTFIEERLNKTMEAVTG